MIMKLWCEQVSFIPRDSSCRETNVQNPFLRPSGSSTRVSGHIQVGADGSLLPSAVDRLLGSSGTGVLSFPPPGFGL